MGLNTQEAEIIRNLARQYKVPEAFALGITDKESAGAVLWKVGSEMLPAIRIEGHYFYARLSGKARDSAVKLGLASPKAGAVPNPSSYKARYDKLHVMTDWGNAAAYESISIGIGQVMGAHYKRLGYASAYAMWLDACNGLVRQAKQMLAFIATDSNLLKAAQRFDYVTFAKGYNGPNYKKNRYDIELRKFTEKWATGKPVPVTVFVNDDTEVKRIVALGFETVREFQAAKGLDPDGKIGPITREALQKAEEEANAGPKLPVVPAVTVAGGAGGALVVDDVVQNPDRYKDILNAVTSLVQSGGTVSIMLGVAVVSVIGGMYIYNRWIKK